MILNTHKSEIKTSETLDHQVATVSLNPVVMHILSRDLYQKHIESPFREVLTNALDAHTEARCEDPIEIHIPTTWDEVFYIRDFGNGLSHAKFMEIYLDYGNSTRRETNEVIGGFGLGTKSPLAYTSSFSVTSYHAGEQRDYVVYYNEDNIPCVDLLSVNPTVETGLKVQFTTRNCNDYIQFKQAAVNLLSRIDPKLYAINQELELQDLTGKELGPLILRQGSGINVIMGHVAYKLEVSTVIDYLSAKNFVLTINGHQQDACHVIRSITKSNCIDIKSKIGEYPVHPSREYINITPRAITLLIRDFQTAIDELCGKEKPTLEDDIYTYKLTGFVFSDYAALPIRARLMPRNNSWRLYLPQQLTTYKELVAEMARNTNPLFVASLSQFDYTDYVGSSSRTHYRYPDNYPREHATLFIDNEERTDPIVIEMLSGYPTWDFSADIEAFRKEKNTERESRELNGYDIVSSWGSRKRRVVKSMQDPKHNILLLSSGRLGTAKLDWNSAQHNVQTLKDLGRPIYWVPTRIGTIERKNSTELEIITRLNAVSHLILAKKFPVIIGLPASKGTKKIESEFKPLNELGTWLDVFTASDYVQRRHKLAALNQKVGALGVRSYMLDAIISYGYADWLVRLNKICHKPGIKTISELSSTKIDYSIVENKVKDLRIKFPDVFGSWGLPDLPSKDLAAWAQQAANLTNCKPTGAKSKNVS